MLLPRGGGIRRSCLALAASLCLAPRPGAAAPPPADAPMTVSEVRTLLKARRAAGEKLTGYGKTVFEGTRIDRFDVEIIDILPNFFPKQDLILIRARHPLLEKGGIVAGMSGSPVYLNDKVIGAVAYGWGFAKEAIGGVTPIESMLAELQRPLERRTGSRPPRPAPFAPRAFVSGPGDPFGGANRPEHPPLQRVRTPLLAAGLTSRALAGLEEDLAPWGFLPLQAGGGGADDGGVELEPGGAVGVQLLSGDSDLTAVGTLTYRDRDRILAFGHPFFNAGEIAMPVTTAVVHTVFPSLAMPFKLASPGREVGALIQDRTACVAGVLGRSLPGIPLDVTVRSRTTPAARQFHFKVLHHELLTPRIVRTAVFGAVDAYEPGMELSTVTATTSIRLRGLERPVEVRDTYANEGHTFNFGTLRAFDVLFDNPYQKPVIEGISIALEVLHEERLAEIKNAWLDEDEVEAGASARLNVVLRVRQGKETIQRVEIPVPRGLHGREIAVRAAGGSAVDPEAPPPTNLRELAAALQAPYESTRLVVVVNHPTTDLRYRGNVLDRIPNSILGPLAPGLEDRALLTSTSHRIAVPTEWVVTGSAEVKIRVK